MISCIFKTGFYATGMFVDAITNITIITNLQTSFYFMARALYRVFQKVVRSRNGGGGVRGGSKSPQWGRGD